MINREFEQIVEYSFIPKQQCFVVRFLDGSAYTLSLSDLPKKMTTNSPDWEKSFLSPDKTSIQVNTNKDTKILASHIIHSKGKTF